MQDSCHWPDCPTCANRETGKSSSCRISNIVYEATCIECLKQVSDGIKPKDQVGRYIGESSRTLAERSREHVAGAGNLEYENFIVKHWVISHSDSIGPPCMRFKGNMHHF